MPKPRFHIVSWCWSLLLFIAVFATTAFGTVSNVSAHFLLNLNVRVFHVDHVQDGLIIHLRTPMPYLVADKLSSLDGSDLPEPAPFTTNAREDGKLVHFVDRHQLDADTLGIGRITEESLVITHEGVRLRGSVEAVVLHTVGNEPAFATLNEAREAMATQFAP